MSEKNSKNTSKSKNEKKEQKLTAAERRRIERESRKSESGEESRFSAFETYEVKEKKKRSSPTDQNRFSNFDTEKKGRDGKVDHFDRVYGNFSKYVSQPSDKKAKTNEGEKVVSDREILPRNRELTKAQRKFRTVLSYVIVFAVIVALSVFLSLTVVFKTTEIVIKGDNIPYSAEEVIQTSGLKQGENIFTSRKKFAAKKIVEKYPYIESAEVSVKIPGTQIITVEAAIPSFQVSVSGGFAVVSAKNRVLEITEKQRANIPLLKGLKVTNTAVGEYISFEKAATQQVLNEVINNINENEVPNIYGIDISNSANIKLNYDNRITILLGVPEDVGYKLRTAMSIINNQLAASDKGDLDVSLANSDRKSSYFTPIYSNTVNIDGSSSPSSDAPSNGVNSILNADEYLNRNNSSAAASEDENGYDYIDDIIEYENEEE